jgi:hypothetical protein
VPAFRYRTPGPSSRPAIDATFTVWTTTTELMSVRRDDMIPNQPAANVNVITTGFTDAVAVAIDGSRYFVADRGADAIVLFDGSKSTFGTVTAPAHVAVDATSVYWASTTSAGRIDKTSRAVETLKSDCTGIVSILADATQLYVADRTAIWARNAGQWRVVASTTDRIGGMALDTDRLYYSEATTRRVLVVSK